MGRLGQSCHFIKCDVEGAKVSVLAGQRILFKNIRRSFLLSLLRPMPVVSPMQAILHRMSLLCPWNLGTAFTKSVLLTPI